MALSSLPFPNCSMRSAGEGTDLVRELAEWALQELIDAEAEAHDRRRPVGTQR